MSTPYGEDLAAIHAAGFTDLAERAARDLGSRVPRPSRVVDLGCGDGTSARLLSDAGHQVHGIDLSPDLVELARRRAPGARFHAGSFRDAVLPSCDAVLAVGEVLGYLLDGHDEPLGAVFERCAAALSPGGLLLFDLADPGRRPGRTWTEGTGWTVLAETTVEDGVLTRRIVTFRVVDGAWRRGEETHRLRLHAPADVLTALADAGFEARVLVPGYGGAAMPSGMTAFEARRSVSAP